MRPFSIGTDICQISRIYNILSGPRGRRFVNRILAPEEQTGDANRVRPVLSSVGNYARGGEVGVVKRSGRDPDLWNSAAFMAGRFAVKEAAIKAHTNIKLTFHDVIIQRDARSEERLGSGPPVLKLRRGETGKLEDARAVVSISHDGDYAVATCLVYYGDGEERE